MCGIAGFFVGCNISIACPKRQFCSANTEYRSPFGSWDNRSSVRATPDRLPNVKSAKFPKRYVPTLRHSLMRSVDEESYEKLQSAALYRFMNFTHKLELMVVNQVTANIALGNYDVVFSNLVRLDAHRIYVDEAYHALMSFHLAANIKENNNFVNSIPSFMPSFIGRANKIIDSADGGSKKLLELMFVIVSELLISGTLRESVKSADMDSGVSEIIEDHARDEARHHGFYRQILREVWPNLSSKNKNVAVDSIKPMLEAYTAPDIRVMIKELQLIGLSYDDATQVVVETYDNGTVASYTEQCGESIYAEFEDLIGPGLVQQAMRNRSSFDIMKEVDQNER